MRKFLYLLAAAFVFIQSRAQTFTPPDFADVNPNHRNYVNNLFGALEANRVQTGLLMDYAFDFAEPKFLMALYCTTVR